MTRSRGTRRAAAAAIAIAIAVVFAGGCSTNRDDSAKAALDSGGSEAAGDVGGGATASAGGSASNAVVATGQPLSAIPASVAQPRIVRNATLRVEVKDGSFDGAFASVITIAGEVGGFVASSTSAAGDDDELSSGQLTVRVPAERFDDVLGRLRKLGKVRGQEMRGDDVGGQMTDLEARLRNLRAQEEAIRALMARTKDVGETLQIQGQLGGVREQIEQLDGQRARLADAVTFATINVELNEPGAAPRGEPSEISKAFSRAADGAEAVVAGVVVAVGYLAPLALLGLLGVVLFRLATHARRPVAVTSAEHGS